MCSQTFILWLQLPLGMTQGEAVGPLGADCTEALVGVGETAF